MPEIKPNYNYTATRINQTIQTNFKALPLKKKESGKIKFMDEYRNTGNRTLINWRP